MQLEPAITMADNMAAQKPPEHTTPTEESVDSSRPEQQQGGGSGTSPAAGGGGGDGGGGGGGGAGTGDDGLGDVPSQPAPRPEQQPPVPPVATQAEHQEKGWNPVGQTTAGFFRFRVKLQRDGDDGAGVPGELRVDAEGVRFVDGAAMLANVAIATVPGQDQRHAPEPEQQPAQQPEQEPEQGHVQKPEQEQRHNHQLYTFTEITSWRTTHTGADGALLDLNVQGRHVIFETARCDVATITKAMLGFIEALVAAMQRAKDADSASRERVTAWLAGGAVAESPLRESAAAAPRTGSGDSATPWSAPQYLRKRPVAVALPADVAAIRQPVATADSSGSGSSPQLEGIRTPERELSVAMRAAAIATEQHSPRTAVLKLASFEQDVLNKGTATSRMQQAARMQDTDAVVGRAKRVAEIATSAQLAKTTPTRIQAQLRTQLMSEGVPIFTGDGDGGACRSAMWERGAAGD
jgi:flagellar hook-basal body complex protein FliE